VQDRGQWFFRSCFSDQALPFGGRRRYQARFTRQEIQGAPGSEYRSSATADNVQNRELQIMRIVRHPNIVELKAFYYSNGERVRYPALDK
jgi:hypothetical protein